MRATDRLVPAAALCAAGLLLGACAADDGTDVGPQSEAADYLADQADLLADRIADDEPCEAIEHGERLVERTWSTVSNGELPTATAAHVEEVVSEIVDRLVCEEPEDAGFAPDEVESGDGDDEGDDGPAEAAGADPGDGSDGRDAGSDRGPDGGDRSTSSRDSGPPGQGEGRGRDGAPGQNRGGPPAGRGGGR